MNFRQFSKLINNSKTGMDITESIHSYGKNILKSSTNEIFVDGILTEHTTLISAKRAIKNNLIISKLNDNFDYSEISDGIIANLISEYHTVKVTPNLIDSYINLAESKVFTIDPVVHKIRELNKLDIVVEGKIHYELADKSIVAINTQTQELLNNKLANQLDIIEYMRENKDNFLHILEQIGG